MPEDQVNDPKTCPNVQCRGTAIDVYDEDGGPPLSDVKTLKCSCEECGWTWVDEYRLEFIQRTDVQRA